MILDAKACIESRTALRPTIGVVLGSGLGAFADELAARLEIPYSEIPGWPASTAVGHAGKLILGKLGRLEVAVMAGRAHLYEGYSPAQATYGVRVLGSLGVRTLVLTNAAGGINPSLKRGGLVLISDHINMQGCNPLAGPNDDALGPRFPDMSEVYSRAFREKAKQVAARLGIQVAEGIYAAMLGPSYETPAEIRYLRTIGADLVGMSTVPEAIVASHMGIETLGKHAATILANRWDLNELRSKRVAEIAELHSLGEITAQQIVAGLEKHAALIDRLLTNIKVERHESQVGEGPLAGKVVVFTGTLTRMKRSDAQARVVKLGGLAGDSVTAETTTLVVGADEMATATPSSKLKKARKLLEGGGTIEILSEDAFWTRLETP